MQSKFLAIRLEGPLQSWGSSSNFNRRSSLSFPTRSGITGILCAAFGAEKGSEKESLLLDQLSNLKLTTIVICNITKDSRSIIEDLQTIDGTITAEGKQNKNAVMTYRQYLTDAKFGIILEGDSRVLQNISDALTNPVWGMWLGRKSCIPSSPLLLGLFDTQKRALEKLLGEKERAIIRIDEVDKFEDGTDSLSDLPTSFKSRVFSARRIKVTQL